MDIQRHAFNTAVHIGGQAGLEVRGLDAQLKGSGFDVSPDRNVSAGTLSGTPEQKAWTPNDWICLNSLEATLVQIVCWMTEIIQYREHVIFVWI